MQVGAPAAGLEKQLLRLRLARRQHIVVAHVRVSHAAVAAVDQVDQKSAAAPLVEVLAKQDLLAEPAEGAIEATRGREVDVPLQRGGERLVVKGVFLYGLASGMTGAGVGQELAAVGRGDDQLQIWVPLLQRPRDEGVGIDARRIGMVEEVSRWVKAWWMMVARVQQGGCSDCGCSPWRHFATELAPKVE